MVEVMAYLEGLAGPPDELQLVQWSKAIGVPIHKLTVEDIEAAELMTTLDWMVQTNAVVKSGARAARRVDKHARLALSEYRKEAREKYAK